MSNISQPTLIDTHTHINFSAFFEDDAKETITRARQAGIWIINVGSQYSTSERAVKMAQEYKEGVYAAVGLHPIHLSESNYNFEELGEKINADMKSEEFNSDKYLELAKHKKTVAIGEIGLDYFHNVSEDQKEHIRNNQKEVFAKQIELAVKVEKPIIVHCRNSVAGAGDAYGDMFTILNEMKKKHPKLKGVVHFFSGNMEDAKKIFALGFFISFTGVITFAKDWDDVIKDSPIEKIMVETDAPYVAPALYRGKRNEPLYVHEVAKRIAEIRGIDYNEVAFQTTINARNFFGI